MTIEDGLEALRKAQVVRPFLQHCVEYFAGEQNQTIAREWWEACSLGYDNYNVVIVGFGPTISDAVVAAKRSQTSIIKTTKTTKAL